ncbi:DUF6386 family protein [Paenibacillus wenxiniae]|uniref:DUF6386 family protein n=1 Tax=Paenibacillus wenxiniae TaxID=1636843 RepID=A0ABW4RH70_9BACL
MQVSFSFTTDTAALAIFDLQAIRHRLEDTPDWWTLEEDELEEINNGHIALLHLQDDGTYDVQMMAEIAQPQVCCLLYASSGTLFAGAAEDTTGGDLEPDDSDAVSGQRWMVKPGVYSLQASRQQHTIQLALQWLANNPNDWQSSNDTQQVYAISEQGSVPLNQLEQRLRL